MLAPRVKTLDDFRREWAAAGEPGSPTEATGLPLAVAALATSSEAVAPATYRASLPYAEDAGLRAGLYYLAEARAARDFGAFCRTLKFDSAGPRPVLRSIEPELDRFERDVVKAYDTADMNARRGFIVINVATKIARERNTSGDYPAALLQVPARTVPVRPDRHQRRRPGAIVAPRSIVEDARRRRSFSRTALFRNGVR